MLNLLLLPGALSVAAQPAAPAARFAGAWTLDIVRSDLGADHPGPDYRLTKVLSWNGSAVSDVDEIRNLSISGFSLPAAKIRVEFTPDGVERDVTGLTRIPLLPPSRMSAKASWQGDNLVLEARGSDLLGYWRTTRRYFLSADGSTLTEVISQTGDQGDSAQRLVFRRAD